MKEKFDYIKRIIVGIIVILVGLYAIVITPSCVELIWSFFGSIALFCILVAVIGIFLIVIGLYYVLERPKEITDKFQNLVQLQRQMHALKPTQKNKEEKKSFMEAFPYFCDNCRMFSYTFLEICENCGAKNTTRKATKDDYEIYLKVNL